jgi:hypothetical protein
MDSVLAKARAVDIAEDPFPHLVVPDALDASLYERLAREFPPAAVVIDGREVVSNRGYHYRAAKALDDPRVSPLWRSFIARHVSRDFFREVVALFGPQIRALHPGLEHRLGAPLDELATGVRALDEGYDVGMECQFTYGTPVDRPSRSIGPHLDRPVALYAGLLYLRHDRDDSTGGDLELYRFKGPRRAFIGNGRTVPDEDVECVRRVEYRRNTLVFLLHSPESLHGVTPRSVTPYPRLHVNLVAEFTFPLYDLGRFERLAGGDVGSEARDRESGR